MSDGIEIYVRDSGDRTVLNIYVPDHLREAFIAGLASGRYSDDGVEIALELSTLPKWITDGGKRAQAEQSGESVHVRVPISVINV
ncbi:MULTISPECIES: hypothetical protein [unclassified Cupriavidus]|uniref:hypothetical protein n=1 Tax=unclassified Cupriavidus TaxID=2640874 RepID=UPI00313BD228